MREMHLFAGVGGGILGGMLLGHKPVCAVEIDPYCQKVLKQRQTDGILPEFPIYGDIKEFDGRPWKGKVDCVCGGFPCQDISVAGKGVGIHGSRSSLFFELIRIVREVEPGFIFLENVPALITRGIDVVLGTLADLGFDAEWCVLSASDCGANHLRKRVWILCRKQDVVDSKSSGHGQGRESGDVQRSPTDAAGDLADSERKRQESWVRGRENAERQIQLGFTGRGSAVHGQPVEDSGPPESGLGGMVDELPDWVDLYRASSGEWWTSEPPVNRLSIGTKDRTGRLRGLGNAQVPIVAATAFKHLWQRYRTQDLDSEFFQLVIDNNPNL